jgi:hypothetical protein
MMYIYVASSWQTPRHDEVVKALRNEGHYVYDYREQGEQIVSGHDQVLVNACTLEEAVTFLAQPTVLQAVDNDFDGLAACEALVLVLPSGRSAHAEFGNILHQVPTVVLWEPRQQLSVELIYSEADLITEEVDIMLAYLEKQGVPPLPQDVYPHWNEVHDVPV